MFLLLKQTIMKKVILALQAILLICMSGVAQDIPWESVPAPVRRAFETKFRVRQT